MDYIKQLIHYKPKLMVWIIVKTGNKDITEDLFQDVFILIKQKLGAGKYVENGKFYNWVQMVTRNLYVDQLRKQNQMPKWKDQGNFKIFEHIQTQDPNPENLLIKNEQYKIFLEALDQLPENQKQIIDLNLFQNITFKEIAQSTGISINTWLARMGYAKRNIKKYINNVNQYQLR